METGINIKHSITIIIFLFFYSCSKDIRIDAISYDYLDFFEKYKDTNKLKSRDFLLRIVVDSTNNNYLAYRIFMEPSGINENELPNRLDVYKKYRIAYFTEKVKSREEILFLKNDLELDFFKKKDTIQYFSNYPEWIVLINEKDKKQQIIKDMSYQSLDDIIEKYDSSPRW